MRPSHRSLPAWAPLIADGVPCTCAGLPWQSYVALGRQMCVSQQQPVLWLPCASAAGIMSSVHLHIRQMPRGHAHTGRRHAQGLLL